MTSAPSRFEARAVERKTTVYLQRLNFKVFVHDNGRTLIVCNFVCVCLFYSIRLAYSADLDHLVCGCLLSKLHPFLLHLNISFGGIKNNSESLNFPIHTSQTISLPGDDNGLVS